MMQDVAAEARKKTRDALSPIRMALMNVYRPEARVNSFFEGKLQAASGDGRPVLSCLAFL
jgi:hypothetical protein